MRSQVLFVSASILINAAMLYSLDHASIRIEEDRVVAQARQAKIAKRVPGPIAFEYVESPKAPARKPLSKTRRISDRDSLNQDMTTNKSLAQDAPQVKTAGPADQLAQKKGLSAPPMPQASPSARSSAAQDRITTTEISKSKSQGAQLYGMTSFEATGSGMGVYMKNLKEKIWLVWYPYLIARYPRDFKTAEAVLSFKLNAQGEVKIVELIEQKGSPLFAAFCMESVQRAGSFGPLPKEILALVGKDELDIKFAFRYW